MELEKYEIIEKVGSGSFGTVYKARNKITGSIVALKETLAGKDGGIPPTALREIGVLNLLSSSSSNNIVRYLGVEVYQHDEETTLFLVFEYADTDLAKLIRSHPLSPLQIQKFLYQLCQGVAYCHSLGVLHRDLKPEIFLVDTENEMLKIADLGISRAFTVPGRCYTDEVVTRWYRAPEVLLGSSYFTGIDIWSIGCIFAQMSSGKVLFQGKSVTQQLTRIYRILGTPNEEVWPGVTSLKLWNSEVSQFPCQDLAKVLPLLGEDGLDLLKKMLVYNPNERIAASAALNHPYFNTLKQTMCDSSMQFIPATFPVKPISSSHSKDHCGFFSCSYEHLVGLSLNLMSKSYIQTVLHDPDTTLARKKALNKIYQLSISNEFDSLVCSSAYQYFDMFFSKNQNFLGVEMVMNEDWAVGCLRMALKFVDRFDPSVLELKYILSADVESDVDSDSDADGGAIDGGAIVNSAIVNSQELVLGNTFDWNFCYPTIYSLFTCLKESVGLKFHVVIEENSASSSDENIVIAMQEKAEKDFDFQVMQLLKEAQLLHFSPPEVASALAFVFCTIPDDVDTIADIYFLTQKVRVDDCASWIRGMLAKLPKRSG